MSFLKLFPKPLKAASQRLRYLMTTRLRCLRSRNHNKINRAYHIWLAGISKAFSKMPLHLIPNNSIPNFLRNNKAHPTPRMGIMFPQNDYIRIHHLNTIIKYRCEFLSLQESIAFWKAKHPDFQLQYTEQLLFLRNSYGQ